jgi:hypothetical protein
MFARSVFSVVRKTDEAQKREAKLAEKWTFVEEQGLDPEIAKRVQAIVIAEWDKLKK